MTRTKKDGTVFAIAGVHGIGKTTIYNLLKKKFETYPNIRFFPERLRANPPVPFGSKDKRIAFRAEIHYLQQMMMRNELIKNFVKNHRDHICILDRTPLTTLVYARALTLPKIDYDLIYDTFNSVTWQNESIIFLEAKPKTIMQRIYRRGSLDLEREKWNENDFEYLKRVLKKYEEIFVEYKIEKKIDRVETENKTPTDVLDNVIEIMERRTGLNFQNPIKVPANQAKLTSWFQNS